MSFLLLGVGIVAAVFVGINIGGSSTGVAFGPAVGSGTVSKTVAAGLMTVFAAVGGWTIGRNVVATMGGKIVPSDLFTLQASIVVLGFIGGALLISNLFGVPASTSMTAVGAIAGMGLAQGQVDWAVLGQILSWWIVSPIAAFWVSAVLGRYAYPTLVAWFDIASTDGSLLTYDRSGRLPRPELGAGTTPRELVGTVLVVVIACYMAFSAGASNVANAVAPLVGYGAVEMGHGILLAAAAIGVGAFTLARRTLDTMGSDLTELSLLAALVVAVVSASLVTFLSHIGIPASFVIIATMSIVGLGWGRATRTTTLSGVAHGEAAAGSVGALAAEAEDAPTVGAAEQEARAKPAPIGEEDAAELPATADLFEPGRTARVIALQNVVPGLATVAAYVSFLVLP